MPTDAPLAACASPVSARRRRRLGALGVRRRSARRQAPHGRDGRTPLTTPGPVGRVSTATLRSRRLRAFVEFLATSPPDRARPVLPRDAAARRHAAPRIRHRRRRSRDRDRAGHVLSGLDVQRSGARADDPRNRRRSRPGQLPQPGLAPAHDSLPRLASAGDGRLAAGASGHARRPVRLRVRRRARSACTSITATPCR